MTAEQAAKIYVASLIEAQLAKAHFTRAYPGDLILDTFENAPPAVTVALAKGLDGDVVAEEMAKMVESLYEASRTAETNRTEESRY